MATPKQQRFELVGSDGKPLRGLVRTAAQDASRPAVLICHGFKGFMDWGFFPHVAERCARAGFTAVSFNFSGSGVGPDGESFSELDRFGDATHSGDIADIDIVMNALRSGDLAGLQPPPRVGIFGHSRGGGAAILFASRDAVDALVTWNSIANIDRWPDAVLEKWRQTGTIEIVNARTGQVMPIHSALLDEIENRASGDLDILAAAARIRIPWLIVHGADDEAVPVADGVRLQQAAAKDTSRLEIIERGSHTFGAKHPWAGFTPELNTALDLTVDWFSRHLLQG